MKREPKSEELWSSIIEGLYNRARQAQGRPDGGGTAWATVPASDLELVCRIARRGVKGYRP